MPPTLEPALAPPKEGAVRVLDEESGAAFDVEPGQIVLDAGLAAGADLPFGCRVGACGACALEVLDGLESCDAPDPIEADALERYQLPENVRLGCRLTCRGPLRVRPF